MELARLKRFGAAGPPQRPLIWLGEPSHLTVERRCGSGSRAHGNVAYETSRIARSSRKNGYRGSGSSLWEDFSHSRPQSPREAANVGASSGQKICRPGGVATCPRRHDLPISNRPGNQPLPASAADWLQMKSEGACGLWPRIHSQRSVQTEMVASPSGLGAALDWRQSPAVLRHQTRRRIRAEDSGPNNITICRSSAHAREIETRGRHRRLTLEGAPRVLGTHAAFRYCSERRPRGGHPPSSPLAGLGAGAIYALRAPSQKEHTPSALSKDVCRSDWSAAGFLCGRWLIEMGSAVKPLTES